MDHSIRSKRDVTQFFWWKSKMYSYIICVDDELRDIIEDDVRFQVNSKGMMVDRKSVTDAQKRFT